MSRRSDKAARRLVIALPMAYMALFFLVPLLIVLKISFAEQAYSVPPITPLIVWIDATQLKLTLTFASYSVLWEDELYIKSFLNALKVAGTATFFTLLIGYPIAYGIARTSATWRVPMLMLVVLPFWTSQLIRIYAWIGILSQREALNQALTWIGVNDLVRIAEIVTVNGLGAVSDLSFWFDVYERPQFQFLYTNFAMQLGIVYTYLPMMILPLYATLEKLDTSLLEAASDLGAKPATSFFRITLPLSLPGMIAGSLLVFIPSVGEVVIPALLGGPDSLMIGRVMWDAYFSNADWPTASALAIVLLAFLVVPIMMFQWLYGRQTTVKE